MKLLFLFLLACAPSLALADTHVICKSAGYEFSFDETGNSKDGVKFGAIGAKPTTGSRVIGLGWGSYEFYVGDLTVRFDVGTWNAQFETPGHPDLEKPDIVTSKCEPAPTN